MPERARERDDATRAFHEAYDAAPSSDTGPRPRGILQPWAEEREKFKRAFESSIRLDEIRVNTEIDRNLEARRTHEIARLREENARLRARDELWATSVPYYPAIYVTSPASNTTSPAVDEFREQMKEESPIDVSKRKIVL